MPIGLLQISSFVHPAIAGIALATGLIPILVHLINRRRYVRVRWAAMSFLLAATRRSARRIRLEQLLLLLVRVGVIVLFGLAIARPYSEASFHLGGSAFGGLRSSRVHRVLLLDNSLSMNAQAKDGRTRFELAKQYAERLLEAFPSTDAVSLVTLSYPAETVIAQAAYDRRFVRERLAAIEPTQRSTDTVGALTTAAQILKASEFPPANRAVYLISDLPRRVWQSETPDHPTGAVTALRQLADTLFEPAVDLTVIRVAPGASDNITVTRLATESPLIGVNLPVRIVAEVTNHGQSTVREVSLQFHRDGEIVRREPLPTLEPGGSTVATIAMEFSTPGTHWVEANVFAPGHNALREDDTRYLSIEVRQTIPVLLVDGRPGATRLAGQAGYLATALAPKADVSEPAGTSRSAEGGLIEPKIVTEPELPGERLSDYDVVALCNVQALTGETWKRLETFVGGGGGLMIFCGDLVSVDNYNRVGYADGAGLLPGKISRPHLTSRAVGDAPIGFKFEPLVHPVTAEFAGHAESGLFSARVDAYSPIELDRSKAEVVLRYTNNDPALIASTFGNGRVILFTTTANMDWTNLPAKGDYVSLMSNATAFLTPLHGDHRNIMVGQMLRERLTAVESSMPLRVTTGSMATTPVGPTFQSVEPALIPDGDVLALAYGPIERAGSLTVTIGSEVRTFTANVDPAESDLAAIDEQTFTTVVARPVSLMSDISAVVDPPARAGPPRRTSTRSAELASMVLYLVVGLLFVEMWMAMRFGRPMANSE